MSKMVMIRSIVRPERVNKIMGELYEAGFPAVTKLDVVGRGKQRGIKVGDVVYDELSKEMLLMIVDEKDKEFIINIIIKNAKTGDGTFGDGKIFVSPVDEIYTISTGVKEYPEETENQ